MGVFARDLGPRNPVRRDWDLPKVWSYEHSCGRNRANIEKNLTRRCRPTSYGQIVVSIFDICGQLPNICWPTSVKPIPDILRIILTFADRYHVDRYLTIV